MDDPPISLVYLTYRPGGFDLLFESLKHQEPIYELIVIDDYPGRVERGEIRAYAQKLGINLTHHGHCKPHSYPNHYNQMMNAYNTGASWCRSNFVVFIHDYVWLPPGAVRQWPALYLHYLPQTAFCGIAFRHRTKPPQQQGDISVWDTAPADCLNNLLEQTEEWYPPFFENFYMGLPIGLVEHLNGFDERVDCGHVTWSVMSMLTQIRQAGCQYIVDRSLRLEMVDHRPWKEFDKKLWHVEENYPPLHQTITEPNWVVPSPNPYDFKELRRTNLKSVGVTIES